MISYLGGKTDLAAVQALATPSAQEGLAQMLSSLKQPTRFRVVSGAAMGDATKVDNDGPPSYTLRMTDQSGFHR